MIKGALISTDNETNNNSIEVYEVPLLTKQTEIDDGMSEFNNLKDHDKEGAHLKAHRRQEYLRQDYQKQE